jgi:hypothetical protein
MQSELYDPEAARKLKGIVFRDKDTWTEDEPNISLFSDELGPNEEIHFQEDMFSNSPASNDESFLFTDEATIVAVNHRSDPRESMFSSDQEISNSMFEGN